MNAPTDAPSLLANFPWRSLIWGGGALLYAIPVAAGLLELAGFDWGSEDYIAAAMMIVGSALVMEIGLRASRHSAYRFAFAIGLATTFFTVWSNLAVGIIGNEDNLLNLIYFAALLAAAVGAVAVRFRARGLSYVTSALAVAQLIIAVIAQFDGYFIWIHAAAFAVLWSASAMLFKKAVQAAV